MENKNLVRNAVIAGGSVVLFWKIGVFFGLGAIIGGAIGGVVAFLLIKLLDKISEKRSEKYKNKK